MVKPMAKVFGITITMMRVTLVIGRMIGHMVMVSKYSCCVTKTLGLRIFRNNWKWYGEWCDGLKHCKMTVYTIGQKEESEESEDS